MAMPLSQVPTTADELDDLPEDGNRYEIIDGKLLVTPTPSRAHQQAQMGLILLLGPYAASLGLELMAAPTDVRASHNTQVEPDLLVLPRQFAGRAASRWEPMSRLRLAVEVLSPSTARVDRVLKRRLYMSRGVQEYWIVDIDAESIDVWTPDAAAPRVVRDTLMWQPVPDRAALAIDVVAVFRDLLDDDT
jgi:Uma2 family endonuclease